MNIFRKLSITEFIKIMRDEVGMKETFEIVEVDGMQAIKCRKCKMISFNQNDVVNRYCGSCHQFHDFMMVDSYVEDEVIKKYERDFDSK